MARKKDEPPFSDEFVESVRKVLSVPKDEVDRQLAAEKRARQKAKGKAKGKAGLAQKAKASR